MSKEALKKAKGYDGDPSLIDTHREVPKAEGGGYDPPNYVVISPVDHMDEHGNLRHRPEELEEIKSLVDDREQMMKTLFQANNRLLAYRRKTDRATEETQAGLESVVAMVEKLLSGCSRDVERWVKARKDGQLIKAMLGVPSCSYQTIAYCVAYIKINKARCASALWSYTGLHCASHERYQKGTAGGGNKRLRTALYRMAESMMKNRECPYRDVYDRVKLRLSVSEKMVKSRNTEGRLVEVMWKDAKACHRHGAALRAIMKHFLADLWFVWRETDGLDTRPLYVEEKLGHTGIVSPRERGWIWEANTPETSK